MAARRRRPEQDLRDEALRRIRKARKKGAVNLDLTNLGLCEIPPEIGKLTAPTSLYLSFNQLSTLPAEIGKLTALTLLDVMGNELSTLPAEIGKLTALTSLDLRRNQLSTLPPEIGELAALKHLLVAGNPLAPELRKLSEKGTKALLAYLRQLAAEKAVSHERKLVFVGAGKVGKTCLLDVLQGRKPIPNRETTYGLEIDREPLVVEHPSDPEQSITLNCWDFGGQETYEITHQFFFSRGAIYLLLWEPRRGVVQCQVEEWLSLIKLRLGPNARVIVVATHARSTEHPADIDRADLRRKFGELIVDFREVDSFVPDDTPPRQRHGVGELRELIARVAAEKPEAFPVSWQAPRQEVLALAAAKPDAPGRSWLPYREFVEIGKRHGLSAEQARTLAFVMDVQGHIVYHAGAPGEQGEAPLADDRLKEVVILQPEWLAKAIGLVLEDPRTREASGVLEHGRLKELWYDSKALPGFKTELRPYFLQLMEKFDVSYRLSAESSLVPQLIRTARPDDLPWLPDAPLDQGQKQLRLVLELYEVPRGFVPVSIVRTHRYKVHKDWHWQLGTFLEHKPYGSALLELQRRQLVITVRAAYPAHFLDVLTDRIEEMIGDVWEGLRRNAKDGYWLRVPCYQVDEEGNPCEGRLDLDTLRIAQVDGDTYERCDTCKQKLDIGRLLQGFELPEFDLRHRLDELLNEVRSLRKLNEEQVTRLAQMFRTLLHVLASERRDAPCTFSLIPDGTSATRNHYRLTLWCEHPNGPHPCSPIFSDGPGDYRISLPKDWLVKWAPAITWMVKLLKVAVPVGGAMLKATAEELGLDELKANLDVIDKMASVLPSGQLDVGTARRPEPGLMRTPEGAELRIVHDFLREVLPDREWGNLRRTTAHDFLWLCPQHYREHEGGPPGGFD